MRYFIYAIIGIVAVSVIAGFFVVGSPGEERLYRFDEQRLQDLQMLQGEVVYYWQRKGELPQALEMLEDDIRGVRVPFDPENGAPYEYSVKGELMFELCATFARANDEAVGAFGRTKPMMPEAVYPETNWSHGEGRTCFERTIDPELYKPIPMPVR